MSGSGPIYEYQREVTELLEQAIRERDEARAEAEKYRGDIVLLRQRVSHLKLEFDKFKRGGERPIEAQPDVAAAYQRGIEAMREAAANYLEEDAKFESVAMSTAAEIYAGIIRRLPTPEDK